MFMFTGLDYWTKFFCFVSTFKQTFNSSLLMVTVLFGNAYRNGGMLGCDL